MKWNHEAEQAISRVPFFVRKKVKKRVEEEAVRCKAPVVSMDHVDACRNKFLDQMEKEVRGFQVENCFGSGGCPNRAIISMIYQNKWNLNWQKGICWVFSETRWTVPLKCIMSFVFPSRIAPIAVPVPRLWTLA